MNGLRATLLVLVLLLGLLSWGAGTQAQPSKFISYPQFLSDTASATATLYPQVDPSTFFQMQQYILDELYEGAQATHSFVLDGQYFDCIPIMEQPSVARAGISSIESLPPPDDPQPAFAGGTEPGTDTTLPSPLQAGGVDPYGNAIACDDGTIPMRRVTLDETTQFSSLADFLHKSPGGDDAPPDKVNQLVPPPPPQAPAPPPPAPAHKYAVGTQAVNNLGGSAHLSLWRPPINQPATEVFSLSQEWYVGGASANLQTVEGGWQVFPRKYRTNDPATFIYWTPDNYTTGCYNLDCVAFVQVNRFFALGAGWGNWSVRGGAQVGFRMKWQLINGNWWLSMQGAGAAQWVGYYPGRIFRGGQLTRNATRAEFGGETFGTTSWPPMGSGAFAAGGWRQAAFQRNIYYLDLTRTPIWTTLAPQQPSPACYTFAFFAAAGGGAWGAYSFFGGPGGGGC